MFIKKTILSLLFFFSSTLLFHCIAQPKTFSQKVDWNSNSYIFRQNEESASYVLHYSIPIDNNIEITSVKILETNQVALNDLELEAISKKYNPPLKHSIEFSSSISRKQQYLDIAINAFAINKESKQIEKLHEFTIEYTERKSRKSTNTISRTYASNSVLSTGDWFKFKVDTSGVFKISYEDLVNIGISNPEKVELFGNGGKQLPYMNAAFNYDDLVENPIYMEKGDDGVFNAGDYILFFGQGTTQWNYDRSSDFFLHKLHYYSSEAYYFLTTGQGQQKRIQTINELGLTPNVSSNSFDSYRYMEDEITNPIRSGRTFWCAQFKQNESVSYPFSFPNLIPNTTVKAKTIVAGRRSGGTPICSFKINYNNSNIAEIPIYSSYSDYKWGYQYSKTFEFIPTSDNFKIDYSFVGGNASIVGLIDYICLNTREKLSMNGNIQLQFRDKQTAQTGSITEFTIDNNNNSIIVWNISNPLSPTNVTLQTNGNQTKFIAKTDSIIEFIAFNKSDAYSPILTGEGLGKIENQNLHGTSSLDMVVVTHPDFIDQANEIAALHREKDNLKILVTTPEIVYNEFSSGTPDVSAIRNFMRMLYDRANNEDDIIKYLLLLGDGSYDNRKIGPNNSNYILTYQNSESLHETASYVTDDFFGLLDFSEGGGEGSIDLGIGRYPVQTAAEADSINNKVKTYLSDTSLGSWRNQICFIGDDGDSNLHMSQPDSISKTLKQDYPEYNINKIYLDAYPRVTTPMGHRYPEVTKAINEQVKKGALIIDYVGHGNPRLLSHEEILTVPDVKSWRNNEKLSIFVTASCEVGRYDDYERTSLGEWMVLNPLGGGVAALTTTRVVYSHSNDELNTNFFRHVLDPDLRLGDVIRLAKKNTSNGINKRNFSLLGDPALKLAVPENKTKVSYINDQYVIEDNEFNQIENALSKVIYINPPADTLNALSKANVAGELYDSQGNFLSNYNGILQVSVYDKSDSIICYGHTTNARIFSFEIQNSVLYKGQASITNGYFDFDFIMPKDINYKYGKGKISMYAKGDLGEAIGFSDNFIIGGIDENAESDNVGPEIKLFMNDTTFLTNGITNENPVLLAQLFDDSGINTTGNGVGHNITAILDGDQANTIKLNDFYQGYVDQYNSGEVTYPFYNLSLGKHTIAFKVWDIYNNSSEKEISFIVHDENNIVISNLKNSPNPFNDETYFILDHNQTKNAIDIIIKVYNLMGNQVAQINRKENNNSYSIAPIQWNGTGFGGAKLPKGMYLYKAQIKTVDGNINTESSKLMIFE